jgi:hypothetical protein
MNNQSHLSASDSLTPIPRLSWSAIFAGAFTGVGLNFLLQLYGIAIGLSAYSSSPSGGATTIAIGGFLGLIVGVIAAMIAAGYVTGYLGKFYHCYCHGGIIYGFLTWSMALVLSAVMLFPFTHYASAYTRALSPSVEVTNALPHPIQIKPDTSSSTKEGGGTKPAIKVTPSTLTGSSWVIFVLFFIGALSSCIGACWGLSCKKACPPESPL